MLLVVYAARGDIFNADKMFTSKISDANQHMDFDGTIASCFETSCGGAKTRRQTSNVYSVPRQNSFEGVLLRAISTLNEL